MTAVAHPVAWCAFRDAMVGLRLFAGSQCGAAILADMPVKRQNCSGDTQGPGPWPAMHRQAQQILCAPGALPRPTPCAQSADTALPLSPGRISEHLRALPPHDVAPLAALPRCEAVSVLALAGDVLHHGSVLVDGLPQCPRKSRCSDLLAEFRVMPQVWR
jgi:hypothetical protein